MLRPLAFVVFACTIACVPPAQTSSDPSASSAAPLGTKDNPRVLGTRDLEIRSWTDEFTGNSYFRSKEAAVPNGARASTIFFTWQRFTPKGGTPRYSTIVRYEGEGWMFIDQGESLIFLLDGQAAPFKGLGSAPGRRDVVYGSDVQEIALYDMTLADLKRIAAATVVRYRVVGSSKNAEGSFSPANLATLRNFVSAAEANP